MSSARSASAVKVVAATSVRSGIDAVMLDARTAAHLIDHTLLKPEATREEVGQLCEQARQYGFWSVCVNPCHVPLTAAKLRGSGVKVCTTIGFPLGATLTTVKRFEASEALRLGAAELDMVMNVGALKSGDSDLVRADIRGVADICHSAGGLLKVSIETGLLTHDEKLLACELALSAGADFVKTSGADAEITAVEDVTLMRRVVGDRMGVKANGAIGSLDRFRALVAAGASRVGTGAAVELIRQLGA